MPPYSTFPPRHGRVRAAWQTQLAAARQTPGLLPALLRRRHALLPRFAASYTQLWALPRRVRRALQRQWGCSLAGIALMLILGQHPIEAATIRVTARCTLVNAIRAANTDAARAGCPAGQGADTIVLPAGSTQSLTSVHNTTYGSTGLPVISSVITIAGQGSTITRASGAPEFRIVAVGRTGQLTLTATTVSGGIVPAPNTSSNYDYSFYSGGGVANHGSLTVTNSAISGNAAFMSGGIFNSGACTITNSTISGNSTKYLGGGVANDGGTLTVTNSTITGNVVSYDGGHGGGVDNRGRLTVTDSTISGNYSYDDGGGIANFGTSTITNSSIAGNETGENGGGVANRGSLTVTSSSIAGNVSNFAGGGVDNRGNLTITNSLIAGNASYWGGGGVANGGSLTITNSTITGNSTADAGGGVHGGRLTLSHTLVAGNTAYYESAMKTNQGRARLLPYDLRP